MASSGINIHLFVSESYCDIEELTDLSNVHIEIAELETLEIYRELEEVEFELPVVRTETQDTKNFLLLMNSKSEFVYRAIQSNIYSSSHFAWIDFGIFHIVQNLEETVKFLQLLANSKFVPNCFYIPGCWDKGRNYSVLLERVNWRFCGGFFLADADSLLHFHNLHREKFVEFVRNSKILPWEVNFWVYLEFACGWQPQWFAGDHNDSILRIPTKFLA
jgi:hypothetical protein